VWQFLGITWFINRESVESYALGANETELFFNKINGSAFHLSFSSTMHFILEPSPTFTLHLLN